MHKRHNKDALVIEPVGDCLEVTNRSPHTSTGWIVVQRNGKKVGYHRIVWEDANGPLLPKQVIRQTCGNRRCCKLEHLSIGQHGLDIQYETNSTTGCHECTSHKPCQYGYPQGRDKVHSTGQTEYLHRIIWKRNFGPIPDGLLVRHKCDNRICINPAHLELGTVAENSQDMVQRGRSAKGAKAANAKLNDDKVREIKKLLADGVFQVEIARRFDVAQTQISKIKVGETWRHVA